MITLSLPTETKPLYTKRYTLDRREWLFRFDWNGRLGSWFLDIGDLAEVWAVRGIRLVCSCDLLLPIRPFGMRADLPAYLLFCFANGLDKSPPGLDDFGPGKRVELLYSIPDELGT